MAYDASFDQARLDQLAEQYLNGSSITGRAIFFSESEDSQLDYATLQFSDSDYDTLKESGFITHLLALLDILLTYRAQNAQPNAGQGAVNVKNSKISIEWLPKESAEAMRN